MPITRYEIRNEYSLADPDLYRAPDKDDPEALLEGVAMAGLVGLLRQLGDLAEFAAEIFHNLHEDVMATASRGHAIAFRVQQLETELPSIERAYLSQTDHSPFFYHPGVDWHPNLRLDNNLVTQGDMPRFIMDSYEECRAPPRLFLLDKFDIAGAGACLKRYTDPSFFKLETSEMTSADIQKEKKVRKAKAKKKGPRWRNRETHEVVPTSHTKLHQLFLEERVENGISIASERAKLKRRLNGFPFNSKAGESYMEKILKSPSPDHNMLHGMTVDSPQLKLATNDHNDYASEVFEIRPVSPYRERGRKRSTPSSPDRESVAHNPPTYDSDESLVDDEICEILTSHPRIATNGISSALDKVTGVKVAAVDSESNKQGSFTDNESDDMVSEIDNFVDAPSTMESEMDRDSDMRMKRDETLPIKLEELVTDAYEEPLHSRSSGSQSTGESTMSDVGNNSSAKEISSFSFDTPSILAEKPHSESSSTKGFQCADISVNEIVDKSSYQDTADEDFPDHHSKPVDSDDTCTETDAFTKHRSSLMHSDLDVLTRKYTLRPPESDEKVSTVDDTDRSIGPQCVVFHGTCAATAEQVTSTLCMNGSMPALELSDPQEVVGDHELEAPRSAEMVSLTDDKEKMMNLVIIPPSFHSGCISGSQSEDHLSRSSNGDQLVDGANDESIPCFSSVHDIYHHTSDSLARSSGLLHDDKSDGENWDLVNDAASTLNIPSLPSVLSTNGTLDMISSGNRFQDKFEDEFPEVPEYTLPDYPDGECNGDDIEPERNSLENEWDDEDSNVATDSLNRSPCIMDASLEKGLEETLFTSACTLPLEDNHFNSSFENEISLEDLKLSHLANSPDSPMEGLDAHNEDVIPEEDTTINETLPLGTPEPFQVVGIQVRGTSYHVSPNDSEAVEISHCASENLEKPAGTSDTVEMDGIPESSGSNAKEFTEITSSADLQSANEIHVLLNKSVSEFDTSNTMGITVPVPEASDGASLSKLVEEHNDKNCPSEGESNHVEEVVPTEASASSFRTIICNSVNSDHPKLELSGSVPNSHLDLELDHSQEVIHAAIIQSPTEQFGHDREQELFNKFDLENHVPDAPSLPIDNATEESVQFGLLPPDLDQHVPHSSGTSAELSPSSPMINLQTLDNDDGKGESNSMSAFSHVKCSNQPSITELVRLRNNEINVSGYPKDPLLSISPPSNPFLEANQINLSDLPPLPPLPPVQWRMGKLLNALPSAEEEMIRNEESFPQLISPSAATDDVGSTLSTEHTHDGSSPPSAPTDDIISLHEMKGSSTEVAGETISKEENLENRCSSFEAKTLHETTDHPSKMENKPQLLATPISETVSTTPAAEDVAENGSQKVKLFRPHNALVDDISFLDKSKLRKVTERIRPEIQKVDERDSLLQQIRTKSFNLRPAMASRPSIRARGPDTNLKVVAILEKANAIRQAFAGSDEDDNDSWSE